MGAHGLGHAPGGGRDLKEGAPFGAAGKDDMVPKAFLPILPFAVGREPDGATDAALERALEPGTPEHLLEEVWVEGGKIKAASGVEFAQATVRVLRGYLHGWRPRVATPEELEQAEEFLGRLRALAKKIGLQGFWKKVPEVAERVEVGPDPVDPETAGIALAERAGSLKAGGISPEWVLRAARALDRHERALGARAKYLKLLRIEPSGLDPQSERSKILARLAKEIPTPVRGSREQLLGLAAEAANRASRRGLPARYRLRKEGPHPALREDVGALWEAIRQRYAEREFAPTQIRREWAHHNLLADEEYEALQALGVEADPGDPLGLLRSVENAPDSLGVEVPLEDLDPRVQAVLGVEETQEGLVYDPQAVQRLLRKARRRALEPSRKGREDSFAQAVAGALKAYPRLDQGEIPALLEQARAGHLPAQHLLALEALPALIRVGLEYAEALGEEVVGLAFETALEAVKTQKSRTFHPAGWAAFTFRRSLGYLADRRRLGVKLSDGAIKALHRVKRVLESGLADPEEIAQATGIPPVQVRALLPLLAGTAELDRPLADEEDRGTRAGEMVPDPQGDPADSLEREWVRQMVDRALERLSERQRDLVERVLLAGEEPDPAEREDLERAVAVLRADPDLKAIWREL